MLHLGRGTSPLKINEHRVGTVGETETVIQAELSYDRSEWHPSMDGELP